MIDSIDGKFVNHRYCLKKKLSLDIMDFRDAMTEKKRSFLSEIQNEKVAISVWTTPKRTKTPPWGHVYYTLPHTGKKITIIPVQASYGRYGDTNMIQPATFSWLSAVGDIYVIIGVYVKADWKPKGRSSANKNPGTPSTQGRPVFTNFQYDLDDLEKQIYEIITNIPKVRTWNESQIKKIPELLEKSIAENERLGRKLHVTTQNFNPLKRKISEWKGDHQRYLFVHDAKSIAAQNREHFADQKLENIPGKKGKVDIDVAGLPKLHLTADSMKVDTTNKIIQLLEGKNTKKKLNDIEMVLEQHVKLMVFFNSDFTVEDEKYQKKLISYLTGNGSAKREDIDRTYREIIQDNNANEIELRVDEKIIK